jgi:hypothetical protein
MRTTCNQDDLALQAPDVSRRIERLPHIGLAIWSLIAGTLKLYPRRNTVIVLSKIWRKI